MFLIKLLLKICVIPLIVVLSVLKWIGVIAAGLVTGVLAHVLVISLFLLIMMYAMTGHADQDTKVLLLLIAACLGLPVIAGKCVSIIDDCNDGLKSFLLS